MWIFQFYFFLLFCIVVKSVDVPQEDDKVCFNRLGCFSLKEPWKSLLRPIPAPMSPEEVGTRVYLYVRPNTKNRHEVLLYPNVSLNGAPLDRSKPTMLITHGFAANGNASWIEDMKDAYLKNVDGNVLVTDWGPGASLLNYLQVTGNTRVVGAELARMIKTLKLDPAKLHLVGHSLGSHISSYAAKSVPNIARLTALDPAQPAFEGFSSDVRLDKDDANFIDVIHTDARPFIPTLGFGMMSTVGHVDFYPNGGYDQPGCIIPDPSKLPSINGLADLAKYPVEVIAQLISCPHTRAQEYFTEALNSTDECIFWGHKASVPTVIRTVANTATQGIFQKLIALSSQCSRTDCVPMGFRTKLSPLRGTFVITTHAKAPYCMAEPGVPPESPPNDDDSGKSLVKKVIDAPVSIFNSAKKATTSINDDNGSNNSTLSPS